jgi:uncharacterized protein YqeY
VEQSILHTLAKRRKESAEAFRNGGRPELAAKEEKELAILERYMPKEATPDQVKFMVGAVVMELIASVGVRMKEAAANEDASITGTGPMPSIGTVITGVKIALAKEGLRVDGKVLAAQVKLFLGV